MRVHWSALDTICRDHSVSSGHVGAFRIEDADGSVCAGDVVERPGSQQRRTLEQPTGTVTLVVTGDVPAAAQDLCLTACSRELDYQTTVADMAEATARLWRQTNALLNMSATTNLALEPGAMLERTLAVLERSTNLSAGVALLRLPDTDGYRVFGQQNPVVVGAETVERLDGMDGDVRLLAGRDEPEDALLAVCTAVLDCSAPVCVARVATDKACYGYLLVAGSDEAEVTSEDLKMLAAAAQILSVAMENNHTLSKVRETTRLSVENELLSAQAREMEEVLHVVAHDLRSPMTAMYGYMHIALDALDGTASGAAASAEIDHGAVSKPLQDSIRSVEKLNRMVQRLLDFSRVARLQYHFEELDLDAVATGVASELAYQIEQQRIDLAIEPLGRARADRVHLEAVLRNLLDNAIKYMGDGSRRGVRIGCRNGKPPVYFVTDSGVGMNPEQLAMAFLPFRRFRADAVPGEGIGLSYVRKIVDRHGGRIWCESAEGVGTTFYFTLGDATESAGE